LSEPRAGNRPTIPYSDTVKQVFEDRPVFPSEYTFSEWMKFREIYREWCERMRKAINQ